MRVSSPGAQFNMFSANFWRTLPSRLLPLLALDPVLLYIRDADLIFYSVCVWGAGRCTGPWWVRCWQGYWHRTGDGWVCCSCDACQPRRALMALVAPSARWVGGAGPHVVVIVPLTSQSLLSGAVPDFMKSPPLYPTHPMSFFAKNLENWTVQALQAMAEPQPRLQAIKIETARSFVLALHRLTSLNHLARAARTVLRTGQQVGQLLTDWINIDLRSVHDTVAAVCGCSAALMSEGRRRHRASEHARRCRTVSLLVRPGLGRAARRARPCAGDGRSRSGGPRHADAVQGVRAGGLDNLFERRVCALRAVGTLSLGALPPHLISRVFA